MMRASRLLIGPVLALAAAGAYVALRDRSSAGTEGAGAAPPRPVPVTASTVEERDFSIYRVGLGTVQAYNTVTVKVRVDGEVQQIAFREGQDVRQGDLLAQIDPRPYAALLQQAEADKARDEALLANARLDLNRFSTLLRKDFATRQSVDTQEAQVAQYEAAVQHDHGAIDNARVQLGYTTITAPLSGRVGLRLIDQGNIVHAGDSLGLVVITQLNPIAVIFTLPQQHLPEIVAAMRRGALPVLAYDQDNRQKLAEGRLELIDNQIDQSTGSMRIKAIFPNDDTRLWPGEFVNAWLRIDVRHGTVVPEAVVQSGPNGGYAYVITPDGSVEPRPLQVAGTHLGDALIAAGLAVGDRVVVDGQYRLRPGTKVIVAPEPKPAPAGAQNTADARAAP